MRKVLQNSALLLLAEGMWHLSVFFLLVAAAREFGAYEYGQFSYVYAAAAILGMFATFGLPTVLTRELAQGLGERTFPTLLSFQMTFGALTLGILGGAGVLFVWWGGQGVASALLLLLGFFWARAALLFVSGFFRARQRMECEAAIRIGTAALLLLVGVGILAWSPGVLQLAAGYAAAGALALAVTLLFFHAFVRSLRFSVDWAVWRAFFRLSWPVGVTVVLSSVLGHVDTVMLGAFGQLQETGWYGAGYRIAGLAVVPAALIGTSFYPVLAQQAVSFPEQLRRTVLRHVMVMAIIGIPISILGVLLAPSIVTFFYGEGFEPAGPALRLLMGAVLMQFFYLPFYFLLLAAKRIRALLWIVGAGAIGNILLNAALIPAFSLYGAAAASVLSYACMAAAAWLFTFRKVL